jgi:hypothetical protein
MTMFQRLLNGSAVAHSPASDGNVGAMIKAAKDKANAKTVKGISATGNDTTAKALMFADAVDADFGASVEKYLDASEVKDQGPLTMAMELDRMFGTVTEGSNVPPVHEWPEPGSEQTSKNAVTGEVIHRDNFDKWSDTDTKTGAVTKGSFYGSFADGTPVGKALRATLAQIKTADTGTGEAEDTVAHPSGEITVLSDFEGMSDAQLEAAQGRWNSRRTNYINALKKGVNIIRQMMDVNDMDHVGASPVIEPDGTVTKSRKCMRVYSKRPEDNGAGRAITIGQFLALMPDLAEEMEHGGTMGELLKTGRKRQGGKGQGDTGKEPARIVKLDESWSHLQVLANYYDNDSNDGVKHQDMLLDQLRKDMKDHPGEVTDRMQTIYNIARALDSAYSLVSPRIEAQKKVA